MKSSCEVLYFGLGEWVVLAGDSAGDTVEILLALPIPRKVHMSTQGLQNTFYETSKKEASIDEPFVKKLWVR